MDARRFDALLDRLWALDVGEWMRGTRARPQLLLEEIEQHVHRNPVDWTVKELFDRLGAIDASDRRFALFLEGLASGEVRPDESALAALYLATGCNLVAPIVAHATANARDFLLIYAGVHVGLGGAA